MGKTTTTVPSGSGDRSSVGGDEEELLDIAAVFSVEEQAPSGHALSTNSSLVTASGKSPTRAEKTPPSSLSSPVNTVDKALLRQLFSFAHARETRFLVAVSFLAVIVSGLMFPVVENLFATAFEGLFPVVANLFATVFERLSADVSDSDDFLSKGIGMYMAVEYSKPPMARHKMSQHYSEISINYDFKASQIDHWCLFGGDNACRCDDFMEPVPREESKGWLATHEANKARIEGGFDYDVVFLGDDVIEEMNGNWFNVERPDGKRIQEDFTKTFTVTNDEKTTGELDGLALGIAGDSAANLLWRMQHGEAPDNLYAKVWWIAIGSNDLARGGCSEEATVLSILRIAEQVYYDNPGSVVVIQGILPRSTAKDGSLAPSSTKVAPLFSKLRSEKYYADRSREAFQLWPSIQNVNKELENFCKEHARIDYFDTSALFTGGVGNALYKSSTTQVVAGLMPDYARLGYEGHKVLHEAIKDKVLRIILDVEDGEN